MIRWTGCFLASAVVPASILLSLAAGLPAPPPSAVPTFSRDIAPILQKRCQECHRPGEVAPMSLLTYADARPWARSIRKEVASGAMPPWHADPKHGRWRNDPRLGEEEVAAITAWADGGAPEGDPRDLPPPRRFEDGWRIGKPDAVIRMDREYRVPARGTIPYRYFEVPTSFTEDRWVIAAEARPGNREVVHHIVVFINEPGQSLPEDDSLDGVLWSRHLCGTAPGQEPDVYPPGTAKLVKAGSSLIFQMHYTPSGTEGVDRSSVGLIFSKEPVRSRLHVRPVGNPRLKIPAGAPAHEVKARYTFRQDSVIWAFMPHLHLRGKSFRYDALFPDGRRETLLSVPRWDFNWQHSYTLAKPLRVEKGARLECTAVYDNSPENKANPDPSKTVRWGDQTWEEMMIGFVTYTRAEGG